jgi:hypothetical protein
VSRDDDSLYFLAESAAPLSPATDPLWMRLCINSDHRADTGWEGYDFIVNRVPPENGQAVVERCLGGWKWERVGTVPMTVKDKRLHLAIPRAMLALPSDAGVDLLFKWADNNCENGDIMDFTTNGDAAPPGRFAYRYWE